MGLLPCASVQSILYSQFVSIAIGIFISSYTFLKNVVGT